MNRPLSPRDDQVMFGGDGVRIKWKNPNDLGSAGVNLEVKECNLVVTFNTNAFALVRRAILDYYKDHKKLSVVYVTDRSVTNERLDKFRITHTNGARGTETREFTITFTNTKTSAIVSGQLTDVYQFILNDLSDIETLIHNRHTESVMLDRKMREMRLEPPARHQGDWGGSPMTSPGGRREWGSPLGSPNPSRRDSFTSSTMSMHSDQDTLDSISTDFGFREATPTLKPVSPRRENKPRPSYLSVNECYFDSSDNSNNSNDSPKIKLSQMNGHAGSDQRSSKSESFIYADIKASVESKAEISKKPPPGYAFCNGVPRIPANNQTPQARTPKNELIPKFPRPKRVKKGSSNFMFAVHMVNIQRSMVNLQKTVAALEVKIQKSLDSPKDPAPDPSAIYNGLLDSIQTIIREELRLIKDDVMSSKTQIKCNRELIKRVYVELNQRMTKDMTDLDGRVSKLEHREKLRKEQRRSRASVEQDGKQKTPESNT